MMENELPEGWEYKKLGDLFLIERGGSPRPIEEYITESEDGINWIKIGDTKGITKYIHHTKEKIKPEGLYKSRMVYEGDFILSNSMSFGRPYIMKTNGCIHDGWLVIRIRREIVDSNYLYYVLSSSHVYNQFSSLAKGSTVRNLNIEAVSKVKIFYPPLAEQTRIVAKLDAAFAHLETLRTSLSRIPELLKKFRQTVLTQAVTGKLTEDWRSENILNKVNLSDLNEARFSLQQAKSREKGRAKFTYKQAVPIELGGRTKGIEELYDVPETWQWVSMDQILWSVSDGPHFSPNYVSKGEGVLFISSRNIFYDRIDFSDAKYVSKEDHKLFIQRGKPEVGDVLLTKGGTTGISHAIKTQEEFSIWVHVALLKVVREYAQPEYLRDYLTSSYGYIQSQLQTHGVGNQDLGLTRMIFFAVPLPPLEEQQEIVNRVESLFATADALEARYQLLKDKIDKLPQALLAKAFRGELVPQDPADEPASVLLAKIKAATAGLGRKKSGQTSLAFVDE